MHWQIMHGCGGNLSEKEKEDQKKKKEKKNHGAGELPIANEDSIQLDCNPEITFDTMHRQIIHDSGDDL